MAASPVARSRRRTPARRRRLPAAALVAALLVVVALLGLGFVFSGSAGRLANGTSIAGVDVGGLSPADARNLLERRAARLATVPVTFTVAGRSFRLTAKELGVSADWDAAVEQAADSGGGFAPIRAYRRLELHFFPSDVTPEITSYQAAVDYELGRIAAAVDRPHREARLVRTGLKVGIVPGSTGRVLARRAAAQVVVDALASFSRAPVALPVRTDPPTVTAASLRRAQRLANRVLSAPVTLQRGKTRWRLPRYRLAAMLELPQAPGEKLRLGGAAADAYFAKLERRVDKFARDATWRPTSSGGIELVDAVPGLTLDVPRSAAVVLAAAERRRNRTANLVVQSNQPSRSTKDAAAMGITGVVGTYETEYGGDPNRIHNVELVAHLVDGKLVAPGATFSFNGATGERSAAKGFLEAPVIINGELQTGLGGGVCQVSTTVFNAAYEAGLPITARTNHALYISHYPLGRDATVDYPGIDLKFVNDTPHWLLLRTFVGPSSLVVTLYGTPQHRRVVTDAQPLTVTGPPPVQKEKDPDLPVGQKRVVDYGTPSTSTSVRRRVYAPDGKLLSDQTWYSSYVAEPKIVEIGTKKAKSKGAQKPATGGTTTTTTTGQTTTSPTTTQPSGSPPSATSGPGSAEG
ncbi:MAG TPA: VanW family protein [Gaiellaceae bacterium]|nr:VanW family protein [Gaiellaceae bacterium]